MKIENISFRNKYLRISTHILFWTAVVIFYTYFFGHLEGYLKHTFLVMVLFTLVTAATTYTFNYYLIPRFLFRKRYWLFGLLSVYTILLSFYFISFIVFGMLFYALNEDALLDKTLFDLYFLIVALFFIVFIGVIVKFYKHWHEKQTMTLELLKEKTEAELQVLKSQINPHFLFNTLNSIYSLSLKKSDSAPEVVLKLSDILDYLLYECDADFVPLDKEIKLLDNYLYLQQVRFGERLKVTKEIKRHDTDMEIAPMLLLPLVENSFKHGVSRKRKDVWVRIKLDINPSIILFETENSVPDKKLIQEEGEKGGIGLDNLRKRLQLIYKEKWRLDTEETENSFKVILNLYS
jgi:two-component system LytT family sensor kinase